MFLLLLQLLFNFNFYSVMAIIWYSFPHSIPNDAQVCWCRVKYYYNQPFLAAWDMASKSFISVDNSFIYPAYVIARWRPS